MGWGEEGVACAKAWEAWENAAHAGTHVELGVVRTKELGIARTKELGIAKTKEHQWLNALGIDPETKKVSGQCM